MCTALLTVKAGEYLELRIKAYAGRVLWAHLQVRIAQLIHAFERPPSKLILVNAMLSELCAWMLKLETYPRYLSEEAATDLWDTSIRPLDPDALVVLC